MKVVLSPHAEDKFPLFLERGLVITKEEVLDCVENPDRIEEGYKGRRIAQKGQDATHVLRVVYVEIQEVKRVITFYPGRRDRYENKV